MSYERLKTKTILIVEDEKVIRDNIASMLGFFFKEVYIAEDGFEGLDQYEQHLPDIVFTDLKMPNMGGFELLQTLRERSSTAYSVIISAHTDTQLLINAIHDGVDRYLIKPLNEKDLFETFDAYLQSCPPQSIALGEHTLFDPDNALLTFDNEQSHLNKKETLLLKLLCANFSKTLTYEEIEAQVWGSESMSLSALRSVIRDLRKKMDSDTIENISGVGYRINQPVS